MDCAQPARRITRKHFSGCLYVYNEWGLFILSTELRRMRHNFRLHDEHISDMTPSFSHCTTREIVNTSKLYFQIYFSPVLYANPLFAANFLTLSKVPPSGERRGQGTERHAICKAPKGEPRLLFWRLANDMPFSSLTATLSARRDFKSRNHSMR